MSTLDPFIQRTHIAYFDGDRAARGDAYLRWRVLAGDMARSSADLELPIVFVSLISRACYVRQDIDPHGRQVTKPNPWQPKDWMDPLDAMVAVAIEERDEASGDGQKPVPAEEPAPVAHSRQHAIQEI